MLKLIIFLENLKLQGKLSLLLFWYFQHLIKRRLVNPINLNLC